MQKIVIIGAGLTAEQHLIAASAHSTMTVVGIFSRTRSKAELLAQKYNIATVADSIEGLFRSTSADGVIICVNETSCLEVCSAVLQYDWKILVEKPVGITVAETHQVQELERRGKGKIFAALNRRHYPSTRRALEILQGCDGSRFISILDQEAPTAQDRRPKIVLDNWHIANSIHLIDLFHVFMRGDLVEIENHFDRSDGAFYTHSTLAFDSGDKGVYTSIWDAPAPWEVGIFTVDKRLIMSPIETLACQTYPSRACNEVIGVDPNHIFKVGFVEQLAEFLKCLIGAEHLLPNLETYRRSLNLAEALHRSKR